MPPRYDRGMNLLLFSSDGLVDGELRLQGAQAEHIHRILKSAVGDQLEVGLEGGLLGRATVLRVGRDEVRLSAPVLDTSPPPRLPLRLYLALPRPKFLGRILQDVTAMGVKDIHLFQSARVEKSYWSSRILEPETIRRHLLTGLQQGRDTNLPTVSLIRSWQDLRAELGSKRDKTLYLAEGSTGAAFPATPLLPASLAVGPEGGFVDREVQELMDLGAISGHLGPRALRVETAVSALISRFLI